MTNLDTFMNNDFVFVSALFNIEREEMDGRKWQEYLDWFEITLQLKCPMILFVTEDLQSFVTEKRKDLPTEIIVQNIDDIPYYHLKDDLDAIISSDEYKKIISDPSRIECNHSIYSIIQFSKFKWIQKASEKNPFDSKFFFWIDAGGSRFFGDYDLDLPYPSPNALEALHEMGDKFLIQMNMEYYKDLANADTLPLSYLLDNRSYVLGSLFGGGVESLKKVATDVEDILLNKMIAENFINNEQIVLGYLAKLNSNDYEIYNRYNGKHAALFDELGKR